jgi:hypothetical protein
LINFEEIADRVDSDPALRRLLQTARSLGISPRRFLGEESARRVFYEYDPESGRMISAKVIIEPEWTEEDQFLMLALADYEARLCGGCNQPLDQTTKAEHDGAYRAGLPIRCHRCTASLQAQEAYQENPQPQALMFPVDLHQELIIKPEDQLEFE